MLIVVDGELIGENLSGAGLREIPIYDGSRRIAVHYAYGLPLRVGP